jgi:hypothetical protein
MASHASQSFDSGSFQLLAAEALGPVQPEFRRLNQLVGYYVGHL